jgi:hypothetical protein
MIMALQSPSKTANEMPHEMELENDDELEHSSSSSQIPLPASSSTSMGQIFYQDDESLRLVRFFGSAHFFVSMVCGRNSTDVGNYIKQRALSDFRFFNGRLVHLVASHEAEISSSTSSFYVIRETALAEIAYRCWCQDSLSSKPTDSIIFLFEPFSVNLIEKKSGLAAAGAFFLPNSNATRRNQDEAALALGDLEGGAHSWYRA